MPKDCAFCGETERMYNRLGPGNIYFCSDLCRKLFSKFQNLEDRMQALENRMERTGCK